MRKAATVSETVLELPFKVDSIAQTSAPEGADGLWHCYVISQGTNTITGVRAGSRAEVSTQIDEMVERLNERRVGKHRPKTKGG